MRETAQQAGVVVVGAGGYSGAELISILLGHPRAKILGLFGSARREKTDEPRTIAEVFPRFRGRLDMAIKPADVGAIAALKPDAVFLATPHEASLELAPALRERSLRVFDLSGSFRLPQASLYEKHYGFSHSHAALLEKAVYGLPELNRQRLASADLVAVPGCYPTSAILPLAPLVRAGALDLSRGRIVIDSTSGVSGAGRSPSVRSLLSELSLQPYNVLSHRHAPEIETYIKAKAVFTPHLVAFDRGILSTIHAQLATGWNGAKVRALFEETYGREPFVRLLPANTWPAVADVRGTNFCDIALAVDESDGHLIMASAIDNLVKGAAGQAVQCMNIRLGLGETSGLIARELGHS